MSSLVDYNQDYYKNGTSLSKVEVNDESIYKHLKSFECSRRGISLSVSSTPVES